MHCPICFPFSILFYFILFYFILCYVMLFYFILFYFILFYFNVLQVYKIYVGACGSQNEALGPLELDLQEDSCELCDMGARDQTQVPQRSSKHS